MRKIKYIWIFSIATSGCFWGFYYSHTISANSFWLDQFKLIEYSNEILEGNFRLVGMRTSRLNWNFPMIHYILTPLIAVTKNVYVLYISTAITYVLGVISLSYLLFKYRPYSEFIIFMSLSLTHVWSLFYSSFMWPPNIIPFFISFFFICFFHYIKNTSKILYFHGAAILLNIAFQLHTMSVVLIFGFLLALLILGKLPRYRHWFIQVSIQILLVSPWIFHHLFVIDWGKEPGYHASLFKDFFSPLQAFLNYLSGTGLTREYSPYLNYGTNTFPHETFWRIWLSTGMWFLLLLIIWALWESHKLLDTYTITWKKLYLYLLPFYHEETDINRAYPVAVYCLFLPTFLYLISGISMVPHYFQFLTPLVFLMLAILPGQIRHLTKRKIAWCGILTVVLIQGCFSYWRAVEENRSPYLDDVGYTKVVANVVSERCQDNPQIRFVSERGIKNAGEMFQYRFVPELEELTREGTLHCKTLLVFQNKLFAQSPVVNWYLKLLTPEFKLETHNNHIWVMGKQ